MHEPTPVVVRFPLRGERWVAVNSPGDRVPSHGTDMLGQTYAFDLLQVDARRRVKNHPGGTFGSLLFGYSTEDAYARGATIHAPMSGEIVETFDGVAEPTRVYPLRSLARAIKIGLTFEPSKLREVPTALISTSSSWTLQTSWLPGGCPASSSRMKSGATTSGSRSVRACRDDQIAFVSWDNAGGLSHKIALAN